MKSTSVTNDINDATVPFRSANKAACTIVEEFTNVISSTRVWQVSTFAVRQFVSQPSGIKLLFDLKYILKRIRFTIF